MLNMNVKSLTEFKHELDATLDSVSDGDDTVIINRPDNKDIVLISRHGKIICIGKKTIKKL